MAKTYTTVPDKGVRDAFTETMWDTQIRDNLNNLIVPPACRARANAAQSVPNAVDTDITWNTEDFDTDTMHDTATNPARITCSTVGIYVLQYGYYWTNNVTGARSAAICLNALTTYIVRNYTTSQAGFWLGSISTLYATTVNTDYFRSVGFQGSGGALNHDSSLGEACFSAVWVGRTS